MMLSGAVSVTDVTLPWVYSTLIPLEVSIEVTLSAWMVMVFIGPAFSTSPMVKFANFSNAFEAAETQLCEQMPNNIAVEANISFLIFILV